WPFMGVFVYAIDKDTGRAIWCNDDSDALYDMVDHNFKDTIGVSPQGYLAVIGDRLLVPCGRSWPACFDRRTGTLLYFRQGQPVEVSKGRSWGSQSWREGSSHVVGNSRYIFNVLNHGGRHYQYAARRGLWGGILRIEDGTLVELASRTNLLPEVVLDQDVLYGGGDHIAAYRDSELVETETLGVRGTGLVVEADGASLPFLQATSISGGKASRFNTNPTFPTLLPVQAEYNKTLVKLNVTGLPAKPPEVVRAVVAAGWVRQADKVAEVCFHRMIRDWSQEASWVKPFPGRDETWDGIRPGIDYEREPFARARFAAARSGQAAPVEGFGPALKHWTDGSWPNHGFVVVLNGPAVQINISMSASGTPGNIVQTTRFELSRKWALSEKAAVLMKAGSRLYWGRKGALKACTVSPGVIPPVVAWEVPLEGHPRALIAASGRLFVMTAESELLCFAGGAGPTRALPLARTPARVDASSLARAERISSVTGVREGYAVLSGRESMGLATGALLSTTALSVIASCPDDARARPVRDLMRQTGQYGIRTSAVVSVSPWAFLPSFLASLIVVDAVHSKAELGAMFRVLRPYGGTLCISLPADGHDRLVDLVREAGLAGAALTRHDDLSLLRRTGPLPGAAPWTHEYGDAARTLCSNDVLVRPPFGLLWYGGDADGLFARPFMTPRYYPAPQVIGGRLFAQSMTSMSAVDVFTGRRLWTTELPDPHEILQMHHIRTPGYPSVACADTVYVACGTTCLKLAPDTGKKVGEITFSDMTDAGRERLWEHVVAAGDVLIGITTIPRRFWGDDYRGVKPEELGHDEWIKLNEWGKALEKTGTVKRQAEESGDQFLTRVLAGITQVGPKVLPVPEKALERVNKARSFRPAFADELVVFDRRTDEVLWRRRAAYGFPTIDNRLGNSRGGAVAVGNGRAFVLDSLPGSLLAMLKRRGATTVGRPTLYALDVRTGRVVWETTDSTQGRGWVAYAAAEDVVLTGTGGTVTAYGGMDGSTLWSTSKPGTTFGRPPVVRGGTVISMFLRGDMSGKSLKTDLDSMHREWIIQDVRTGEVKTSLRAPGAYCGFATSSQQVMAFRATSVAFYDYAADRVMNLSGFRGACATNLIPADGVLSAPHLGWHCMCNYPIFTSTAFIHMPEVDAWSGIPPQPEWLDPETRRKTGKH
ncbi:MAG: PQQ-binding-like beta-propeller repeat protein, partial [Lentisphaerae bacterium]|nr:PQQ-binding-like beta-propeller repeat protein [Lentisphaerota bacterium]